MTAVTPRFLVMASVNWITARTTVRMRARSAQVCLQILRQTLCARYARRTILKKVSAIAERNRAFSEKIIGKKSLEFFPTLVVVKYCKSSDRENEQRDGGDSRVEIEKIAVFDDSEEVADRGDGCKHATGDE